MAFFVMQGILAMYRTLQVLTHGRARSAAALIRGEGHGPRPRDFDQYLSDEELVEYVSPKHVQEFAGAQAAVDLQALADQPEATRFHRSQRLPDGEHGITGVQRVEGHTPVVTIAMDVSSWQEEAIAFVDSPEVTGHPNLLAHDVLLGVSAITAKGTIQRAEGDCQAQTQQQRYARDAGSRELRHEERKEYERRSNTQKQPVGHRKQPDTSQVELESQG